MDPHSVPGRNDLRDRQCVVWQDLLGDFRHTVEDFTDIEDSGKRPQQAIEHLEASGPLAKRRCLTPLFGQFVVREPYRDTISQSPRNGHVGAPIFPAIERQNGHAADDTVAKPDW